MNSIFIERYTSKKKNIWDVFVKQAKNPIFMFCRDYMDYHNDRFTDHSLMFYEKEKLVAVLPANESENILFSHGGLTYGGIVIGSFCKQHTVNDCVDSLIDYLRDNKLYKIVYKAIPHIFHINPCEEDIYALHNKGAVLSEVCASTVIDFNNPLKMSKGRKAQISRARREGVEIVKLTKEDDYKRFIELENKVLEEYHETSAVHTAEELYLLHTRFDKNIHLYGALKKAEMIAGTVIFEYENVVHTQYMAANDMARQIGALDLCIKTIMDVYSENKRWLDFGISTENGGRILNEGLISQKEGFGGRTNVYKLWELII